MNGWTLKWDHDIDTTHGQRRQFWSKHFSSSRLSSAYFLFLLLIFSSSVALSSLVFLLLNLHLDLILFLRYFFLLLSPFFFHFLLLSFFIHLLLILIFSFPPFWSSSFLFYCSLVPPFTSTSSPVFSLPPPNSTSSHFPPLIIFLPCSSSFSTFAVTAQWFLPLLHFEFSPLTHRPIPVWLLLQYVHIRMLRCNSSLPYFLNFTLSVLLPWLVCIRTDSH